MPPVTTPKTKKENAQPQQRRDHDDGNGDDNGDGLLPPIDTTGSPAAATAVNTPTSTKSKRKKFTKKKKAELKEEFKQGPGLSQSSICPTHQTPVLNSPRYSQSMTARLFLSLTSPPLARLHYTRVRNTRVYPFTLLFLLFFHLKTTWYRWESR